MKTRVLRNVSAPNSKMMLEELEEEHHISEALEDLQSGLRDEEGVLKSLVKAGEKIADRQRRLLLGTGRYTGPRPGRSKEQLVKPATLAEHDIKCAHTYADYLAQWAAKRLEVVRFRSKVLGNELLTEKQVFALMASLAAAIFPARTFKRNGIPLVNHTSEVESDRSWCEGDWQYHRITVYVEPPGINLSIEERYNAMGHPPMRWFAFGFIDEEGEIERFAVRRGSVLDRLRKVSSSLAQSYPWGEVEAAHFVLTGKPPEMPPLTGTIKDETITITAAPWVSYKTHSQFYRQLQHRVRQSNNRPLSDRARAVLLFVSKHIVRSEQQPSGEKWAREGISWWKPSWEQLLKLWNEEYPDWRYKNRESLYKAYRRAHRALLAKDSPRSW